MDEPLSREWLVTNGLGGYASGTRQGPATRRYHGLRVAALAALKLRLHGRERALTVETRPLLQHLYRTEERRGYPADGKLVSPGVLRVDVARDADATLVASTEAWEAIDALAPEDALAAEL